MYTVKKDLDPLCSILDWVVTCSMQLPMLPLTMMVRILVGQNVVEMGKYTEFGASTGPNLVET